MCVHSFIRRNKPTKRFGAIVQDPDFSQSIGARKSFAPGKIGKQAVSESLERSQRSHHLRPCRSRADSHRHPVGRHVEKLGALPRGSERILQHSLPNSFIASGRLHWQCSKGVGRSVGEAPQRRAVGKSLFNRCQRRAPGGLWSERTNQRSRIPEASSQLTRLHHRDPGVQATWRHVCVRAMPCQYPARRDQEVSE